MRSVADGPFDSGRARHRHPQWRAAGLDRVGRDAHVIEPVALACVTEAPARPREAEDVDALLGARDAVRDREAEPAKLVRRVAQADAELDAAARQLIEHGEILGKPKRMRERDDRDVRRDPDPLRRRRGRASDRGERRQVAVLDEVVLAEPDLVEAELVESSDLVDRLRVHVVQRVVAAGRAAEVVRDAEPHRRGHANEARASAGIVSREGKGQSRIRDIICAMAQTRRSVFPGFDQLEERRREVVADLARVRGELGLSQTEVAARMGTSQSAVARLESGDGDVRLSSLQRYAEALGRDLRWRLARQDGR